MRSTETLLAIVLGGVALGACGSSNSPDLFGSDTDDGGAPASGSDAATDGSRDSLDSGSSSDGGPSADSGSSPDSGAPADPPAPGAASGFAIPLASPDGPDDLYTAQVTVGSQTFAMDLDTGSTTLGVAGMGCSGCTGLTPVYTPSSSATATGKTGKSTYADGSGWSGPIYKDTVGLGNGTPAVSLDLVDITKANGGFFDSTNDYQGILGLGPSANAVTGTTGYIPALTGAGVANVFAFQLCDNTGSNAGTMWLGGDGPSVSLVYTPLLAISNDNAFYAINVDGMSLGGTSIVSNAANTFQQPVLDTGTSLFYVPTSVFNAFQSALEASSGFKALFGTSTFAANGNDAGCVTVASVTDAQVETSLPPLTLSLPSATSGQPDVTIQASALDTYLDSGGGGQYCLAIQDGGTQDASTFGDAFLQAFVTVIDVDGGRVGFAPTGCATPELRRVRHPAKNGPHRGPRPGRY
jgi:Eukaryotic aspartyl protease